MGQVSVTVICFIFAFSTLASAPTEAAKWPSIPDDEWALTRVEGHPNAPAVVLLREGFVHLSEDYKSSYIQVYARVKILNEEGVDFGSIELESSDFLRTKNIAGRTHLPDGSVSELNDDAIFEREFSDYYDTVVVTSALPDVVPGAIIEYTYRTYFDGVFYPREWTFQEAIPTLRSQVRFEIPKTISFYPVEFNRVSRGKIPRTLDENVNGSIVTYTLENLPPVADEPYRFPYEDLVTKVLLLPGADHSYKVPWRLFDSWESILGHYFGRGDNGFNGFKQAAGTTKRQAKELAQTASSPHARAVAIYEWVRDEIDVEPYVGLFVGEPRAEEVFKKKKGSYGEKANLLKIMLDAARIDSRIAWTNPRNHGMIAPGIPNPRQFHTVLVVAEIDGENVFLDPGDRRNGFGVFSPALQGVDCFVISTKSKFEWLATPALKPGDSTRTATVDLALDADGAFSGTGQIELTGGSAWRRLRWGDSSEETVTAWTAWIEDRYPGFDIDGVEVAEDINAPSVAVSWNLDQRDEVVLGDEAALAISSPYGLGSNPFTLTHEQRTTPVRFDFPRIDRTTVTVTWSDGWSLETVPPLRSTESSLGSLHTTSEIDDDARRAVFEREFVLGQMEVLSSREYSRLRSLFRTAVANDSRGLLLIAE